MKIVDAPEGWTWAKKEDLKPLHPIWKRIGGVFLFAMLLMLLVGVWGWALAFVALIALNEMRD